jgi:hypothetical protein
MAAFSNNLTQYQVLTAQGYTSFSILATDSRDGSSHSIYLTFSSSMSSALSGEVYGSTPFDYAIAVTSNDMQFLNQVGWALRLRARSSSVPTLRATLPTVATTSH